MQAATALALVIDPTLAWLEPLGPERDDRARRLLLAIAWQESGLLHRQQFGRGPARGLWQFEAMGGVKGVLEHPATEGIARIVCGRFGIRDTIEAVHPMLAECDALACAFARLLLWTDVRHLPVTEAQAWGTYQRVWRPGRPRPDHWADAWRAAVRAVSMAPLPTAHADVKTA